MNELTLIACVLPVLLLPLLSALLSTVISSHYRWVTPLASSVLMLITTILALVVFANGWNTKEVIWQFPWFYLDQQLVTVGLYLNNTTLILLIVVSFVSLLVHIFSIGYMAGDAGEQRYFGMLGFFTFSMIGLVLADNLLLLFIFWELVGFSSYILIGHWREKPKAAEAAKKAFIINRVADLGFIIGLLIIWTNTGSFGITAFSFSADGWQTTASLFFLLGVMGKSAQLPFFNWLPSAMEGPTPVSALIHAATMVVAGVFLLIRLFPLFTPLALDVITIVGCLTSLAGALAALQQFDLKKILAYSTISQLGLMIAAIGSGAYGVALLHLFTHAFFKAGLFLGVGSVIHALHQAQHLHHVAFDAQDIRHLGGLRKAMPVTFICFAICSASLMGLPLFSGFQSKDAILISLFEWSGGGWRSAFFWTVVASSVLTLFYTVRMVWFVFLAPAKKTALLTISEAPAALRFPLIVLSLASLWLVVSYHPLAFSGWLLTSIQPVIVHNVFITWLSLMIIPAVSLLAWWWYKKRDAASQLTFLENGFYLDTVNQLAIVKPVLIVAHTSERIDKRVIDGFLHGLVYAQVTSAHLVGWFDKNIVDGAVDTTGRLAKLIGSLARSFSGGKIQTYIFWTVFVLIIFLFWVLF